MWNHFARSGVAGSSASGSTAAVLDTDTIEFRWTDAGVAAGTKKQLTIAAGGGADIAYGVIVK